MTNPPNTLRYCCICKKNTIFVYNHMIGHSRCYQCGQGYSEPVKDKLEIDRFKEQLIKWLEGRIFKLTKEGNNQVNSIRRQEIGYLIERIKVIKVK